MASVHKHPAFWGGVATLGVVVFAVWLGTGEICDKDGFCQTRFADFLASPANEVGDTLAGFAGALAFVWIIVTVWLQALELKAQREELHLTRNEIAAQSQATQDMARSMTAQAAIFEQEQAFRTSEIAGKELAALIVRGVEVIQQFENRELRWESQIKVSGEDSTSYASLDRYGNPEPANEFLKKFCLETIRVAEVIFCDFDLASVSRGNELRDPHFQLLQVFQRIEEIKPSLSAADILKIEGMRIEEARIAWSDLINEDALWENRP